MLVMLGISTAFDTIDHSVVLQRLQSIIGITGKALTWFTSYRTSRVHSILINGSKSRQWDLLFGDIPQGLALGPILFMILVMKTIHIPRINVDAIMADLVSYRISDELVRPWFQLGTLQSYEDGSEVYLPTTGTEYGCVRKRRRDTLYLTRPKKCQFLGRSKKFQREVITINIITIPCHM